MIDDDLVTAGVDVGSSGVKTELSSRSTATSRSLDARRYRDVLGHFPTGVAVVTAMTPDEGPVGMAAAIAWPCRPEERLAM